MNPSPLSHLVRQRFREALPADLEFCSLRLSEEQSEVLSVRRHVPQPVGDGLDVGAMITVSSGGGLGYAATTDLSLSGIRGAIDRARRWAERTARVAVFDYRKVAMPAPVGEYHSRAERPWSEASLPDRLGLLREVSEGLPIDPRIVEWEASLVCVRSASTYLTSHGGEVHQTFSWIAPDITVVAAEGSEVQRRTFGGLRGYCQQGGLEVLDRVGFLTAGPGLAREALELLSAPNCPSGRMDLLLDPDQMMLQIHESIGHPLELDRILGDERNYAGTSFVTLDMFGSYQYGSELLNVTFDPTLAEQFASYGFDDEGRLAERAYLIREGRLERPLGGTTSQARSGLPGVANARASSWNRPPIDRMANLNVEPGQSTFRELVSKVERGVYLRSNNSWSIDDSRNKFQFGCEHGRLIEDGELKGVVKNPNYRGISSTFWRSLIGVGDRSTFQVLGTPYCGKGEPNQVVRVGHASPACLFTGVDVFGGV